jgi:hypothetical protein
MINAYKILVGELKGGGCSGDLGLNWRIILKLNFKKWGLRM